MTRPAWLLLALALALPSAAAAQELAIKPPSDIYFFASPDPLTRSVLRCQLADQRSGCVVSAKLVTSADALKLPVPAIARGAAVVGAEGASSSAVATKAGLSSGFLKRSIAAAQLLTVVEAMRSKARAQRVPKGTP